NHPTRVLVYQGRPFDRVNQRSLQRAADRAVVEKHVHPHLFRHTWASWHIMAGTSLAELQALGGWSKVDSVLIYAHLSADHLRQAAERSGIGRDWMETKKAPARGAS
ncbi:MAG: site-specific integrase, partial [Wenzhouxiangella sp.]|nr:site-specific integrase [Wenzhouxiangella sp.]